MQWVKRYEALRRTFNMEEAITQLAIEIVESIPAPAPLLQEVAEWVRVLDWLLDVNANGINNDDGLRIIMNDGEFYWNSDIDGDQPLSAEKIIELYKKPAPPKPNNE